MISLLFLPYHAALVKWNCVNCYFSHFTICFRTYLSWWKPYPIAEILLNINKTVYVQLKKLNNYVVVKRVTFSQKSKWIICQRKKRNKGIHLVLSKDGHTKIWRMSESDVKRNDSQRQAPSSCPLRQTRRQGAGAAPSLNDPRLPHVTQRESLIINTASPGKWWQVLFLRQTRRNSQQQRDQWGSVWESLWSHLPVFSWGSREWLSNIQM